MTHLRRILCFISCAIAIAWLAGCQQEELQEVPAEPTPEPTWLVGSHAGQFPCVDCPGIDTRLWLREDGAFFYRQNYLAGDDAGAAAFYAMGRWHWDPTAGAVALEGDGPTRWFEPVGDGTLRFRTNAQPEHLLNQEEVVPPFDYLVTLEGDYTSAKVQRFKECRTNLNLAIVDQGEGRRLRRQYRSMPRGQPIVAVVNGRIKADADNLLWLSIERIVTLKPGVRCPGSEA